MLYNSITAVRRPGKKTLDAGRQIEFQKLKIKLT